MMWSLLFAFLAVPTQPSALVPVFGQADGPSQLRLAAPTFFRDGKVRGAASEWTVSASEPLVVYQYSGSTLCDSSSAVRAMPSDAGYGWRVEISRVSSADGLVLNVNWQRLWQRGVKLADGPRGAAQVTLQPGVPVLFDYISASDDSVGAGRGDLPRRLERLRSVLGCAAIGMGLELRLAAPVPQSVVEANLWLVRTLPNGTEQAQRQVLRARRGNATEFFFDDVTMGLASRPGGAAPVTSAPAHASVRTSGQITPLGSANGKLSVELVIAQFLVDPSARHGQGNGGSTTYEFAAGPDEVVAFNVPQVTDNSGRRGERLSLRVQLRQVR